MGRWFDRLGLWFSTSKSVDGLLISTLAREAEVEEVVRRVEAALGLIKACDRLRYDRLRRDLGGIRIQVLLDGVGNYNASIDACQLDTRFVLASSAELIASTIVHEATHARLKRRGIGYEEELRARVEAVCLRREIAFAAKMPNGEQVREWAERGLQWCGTDGNLTDAAFDNRRIEAAADGLRYLRMPNWLVRILLAVAYLRRSVGRPIRSLVRRRPGSKSH